MYWYWDIKWICNIKHCINQITYYINELSVVCHGYYVCLYGVPGRHELCWSFAFCLVFCLLKLRHQQTDYSDWPTFPTCIIKCKLNRTKSVSPCNKHSRCKLTRSFQINIESMITCGDATYAGQQLLKNFVDLWR